MSHENAWPTLLTAPMFPVLVVVYIRLAHHGMDFSRLMPEQGYNWRSFFSAAWIMALWAFAMGATFAWLSGKLNGGNR